MGKLTISGIKAQTIMRCHDRGMNIKDIAIEVGLSQKFVSRLLKNGVFISRYGKTTLYRAEPQPHPDQHPCMLRKKLWPKCYHGEHCYLSRRCGAWTNFVNERDAICGL
jgi:CRISPR/Cas system-associated endonuclease Cas1